MGIPINKNAAKNHRYKTAMMISLPIAELFF